MSKKRFVETRELTKSFGWTENDSFQQHDIQELLRVLFEALEISYNKGFWNPGVVESNSLIEYLYKGRQVRRYIWWNLMKLEI